MGELTELGKFLRKLRIDNSEYLKGMAAKLAVTVSFLSSVENGNKNMPSEWMEKIPNLYNLTKEQKSAFDIAVGNSEKKIGVRIDDLSPEKRKLSAAFARVIRTMNKKDQEKLQQILF